MSPLNSLQEPSRYSICNQPHSAKWWAPLCGHYCSRIYCSKTTGILKAIISLYLVLQIIFIQSPVHSLNIVCFYLGYLLVLFYGFFVCLLACFFFFFSVLLFLSLLKLEMKQGTELFTFQSTLQSLTWAKSSFTSFSPYTSSPLPFLPTH